MEKITKNDIIINELNSFSTLTCCYEIEDYKLLACGDKKGRILLFDIREKKPIVKLILTNNNNNEEINNIQFNKNSIFFSTDNNIYSIDIFSNNISNKIYSNPKIRIKNSNEENEINDFLLLPDNTIIYPDLESEQFLFFHENSNENSNENNNNSNENNNKDFKLYDTFSISSAYGQEYINFNKKVILYSFDGEIIQYDYKTKETILSSSTEKYDSSLKKDYNNISNPPYLNKIIYNKNNNEIICAMMNGYLLGLKSNFKFTKLKNIHNGNINEIKMSKFNVKNNNKDIISFGRDKCLKLIDSINNNFNIDYYFDMNENIIDFDSDVNNNIFYIDDIHKTLFNIKFKG
jgi:hypothetical protein